MSIFDFFRREQPQITESYDEKKQLQREKESLTRERQRADMALWKLEAEKKKIQLEEELEEMREERELRRMEREVKRAELEEVLYGSDEPEGDTPEAMLIGLLSRVLTKNSPPTGAAPNTAPFGSMSSSPAEEQGNMTLSADKLAEMWQQLPPQYKTIAKSMTDDELKTYIINQMPNIDAASLQKAVSVVRSQ